MPGSIAGAQKDQDVIEWMKSKSFVGSVGLLDEIALMEADYGWGNYN